MSSRYLIHSDIKKRYILFKKEHSSKLLRCVYNEHLIYSNANFLDSIHSSFFHFSHYLNFKRTVNSMYRSKVRNKCVYSGSSRAVFGKYKLSRFFFKMYARNGQINGITKSSW